MVSEADWEIPPLGHFIAEELEARGWTAADLAKRMGGTTQREMSMDQFCVEMLMAVHDVNLLPDEQTITGMAAAFGVSPEFFRNLDNAWRAAARARGEG